MDDLISRQSVLDILNTEYAEYITDDEKGLIERITMQVTDLPSASRWIPVSERLPEEGDDVLWCTRGGYVCSGTILCGVATDDCGHQGNYIAWMPLPEPYKGGERRSDE